MHAAEVDTDVSLVRRLLAAQFPHWADLPIEPVHSSGSVALIALPYYIDTNPVIVERARHMIDEVLADHGR